MSTDAPTTNQCSICLDGPPYDRCAGSEVPGASSCAYLIELEAKLASAQATITGDGKVIDEYRERLASFIEERDRLTRALEKREAELVTARKELCSKAPSYTPLLDKYVADIQAYADRAELAEQQLAASREAVIEERHWVYEAAERHRPLLANAFGTDKPWGFNHLSYMLTEIVGMSSATKACRWLGWVQACLCFTGCATLDELKAINKQCSDAFSASAAKEGK